MFRIALVFILFLLSACASSPPSNKNDICSIFTENPKWYKNAKSSAKRWGGPIHVPMSIIYQESSFKSDARPPMQYFLGIIPKGRASNAYGYSQALKGTWAEYQKDIGSSFRDRDDFSSAIDFVFWYMNKTYQRNKVSKWDGYAQYLNYHEGQGGYARGSYKSKQWLIDTARKVDQRAKKYATQLSSCKEKLDAKRGWF